MTFLLTHFLIHLNPKLKEVNKPLVVGLTLLIVYKNTTYRVFVNCCGLLFILLHHQKWAVAHSMMSHDFRAKRKNIIYSNKTWEVCWLPGWHVSEMHKRWDDNANSTLATLKKKKPTQNNNNKKKKQEMIHYTRSSLTKNETKAKRPPTVFINTSSSQTNSIVQKSWVTSHFFYILLPLSQTFFCKD